MQATTFKKRTLVTFEVDESSEELVVSVLRVFYVGQRLGGLVACFGSTVLLGGPMWQLCGRTSSRDQRRSTTPNAFAQVSRTMSSFATNSR